MHYGQAETTLGEKIITVIGCLFLSTVVAAVMIATYLVGVACCGTGGVSPGI